MKKKIYIYDDEARYSSELRQKLSKLSIVKSEFEILSLAEPDFKSSIKELSERQLNFRKKGRLTVANDTPIDEANIFIVDFDLIGSTAGQHLTGELVAYLARCFSSCGLIIGLNLPPNKGNGFDLTLKGHPESFADLNIGGPQLSNPGLWGGDSQGFRPWSWPIIPLLLKKFEKRQEDVEASVKKPIEEMIGFSNFMSLDMLPRTIGQFLGKEQRLSKITPYEFVTSSGNGLRPKDYEKIVSKRINDDISLVIARVAAARLYKWLERIVLPGQDLLIDAPHLANRYPSLLKGKGDDINNWNKTATKDNHIVDAVKQYKLKPDHWLSRPVWFWEMIRKDEKILEVKEPWKINQLEWVFCEDASKFYKRNQAQEFQAEVESPFTRRYIKQFKTVEYYPLYRLSL